MLTGEQTVKIYRALGTTPLYRQINPAVWNAIQAVNLMADPALEAAIAAELTRLDTLESQLVSSMTRLKFTRVEDVYFNVGAEAMALLSQGRMYVNRLAALLGVTVVRDIFSTGSGAQGGRMKHG